MEIDPSIMSPTDAIAKGIGPLVSQIHDDVGALKSELQREQSITSEVTDVRARITAESSTRLGQPVGKSGPGVQPDGTIYNAKPSNDVVTRNGPKEFGDNSHVFFANGINTKYETACVEATMLSARIHQPVDLVYVRTENLVADVKKAIHETFNHEEGKLNPPERALAAGIIESIDKGENVHVIGFSRGALVTQLAIEAVDDHHRAEGHSSRWVVENVNSHITVETFNGASHSMPEGVRAKHYVRDDDLLVAQSIGMGKYTPEVRGIAGAGIDSALALINELPPEKREAAARDYKDLVKTTDQIALDAGPMHATESLLGQPDGHLRQDLLHMRDDLRALSKDLASPPPTTPAADEIHRDGYYNTPNGPIVTVPPFLDASAKNPLQWVVDQHDLPQMLEFRQPFESHPAPQARGLGANLGDDHASRTADAPRGVPQIAEVQAAVGVMRDTGSYLPDVRTLEPWNGQASYGSFVDLGDGMVAHHSGRGAYSYLDVQRDLGGIQPPFGQPVALSQNGQVQVPQVDAPSLGRS